MVVAQDLQSQVKGVMGGACGTLNLWNLFILSQAPGMNLGL